MVRDTGVCEKGFTEDLPPEFCRYKDEGCEMSASCLECPLPHCIYDEPGGRSRWLKKSRDREIQRLYAGEGKTVAEMATLFGVSRRTIQRALKRIWVASRENEMAGTAGSQG